MRNRVLPAAVLGLLALASAASAHVELAVGEAPMGSHYHAMLRVPHGCSGSPTIAIRVQVPDGVTVTAIEPKAGWAVGTAAADGVLHPAADGATALEGVRQIVWSGGSLPPKAKGEFGFEAMLPADLPAGSALYFPVVQECETGLARWIEIPAAGKSGEDYEHPAPALVLLPMKADAQQ